MTSLARGQLLGQRFQLIRPLGKGGMGEVWLADDRELEDRVVAKVIPKGASEDALTLLRRECRHARKLVHKNIVPVYDFHRGSGVSFITMAYVEGENIGCLRGVPLKDVLAPLISVADALAYAHAQGIVHRDLKAPNILIDPSGEPQLLDFGIAGVLDREPGALEIRGGGSEGTASPQQLAGETPSPTDDIYAFGMLVRDLTSGEKLPSKLEALLSATTNRDPRHRPTDMRSIQASLEEIRREITETPAVKLTPPPRVTKKIEPVAFDAMKPPTPTTSTSSVKRREDQSGGMGFKTLMTFAVLVGLAGVVFFVLPSFVVDTTPASTEITEASEPAPRAELAVETADLETLAESKALADKAQERAAGAREALEARQAQIWGGEDYRLGVEAMTAGGEQMQRREFARAETTYEEALTHWNVVQGLASGVVSEALARGRDALAAGRSTEATDAFALVLKVQPGSSAARTGLERSRVLDEVRTLTTSAEELEARGDLDGAAERYRKAVSLDPLTTAAQKGLARIDKHASEQAFTAAMSEAVAALNARDFPRSREAFERARAIKPKAPDVTNGLAAVAEGERLATIAENREKARGFEAHEAWRSAAQHYQAVLDVDATIRFAQEGKARAEARADLSSKLTFHVGNPARLSEAKVLDEASRSLQRAMDIEEKGPRLAGQIERLDALVREYSTPVQVYLLSDKKTEVVVYRVGTLGKFDRHALVLRPGTYTVVGTRRGYRDVRLRLVVEATAPPEPLLVRCEEKI
ncbi:MAG: serine/threonine protein kinase [Acidobacteria bacterium]|nr:MAG: serine/threonine protein kinase [Acidobacteriota bacterium]